MPLDIAVHGGAYGGVVASTMPIWYKGAFISGATDGQGRYGLASDLVNGGIFNIGGMTPPASTFYANNDRYDPTSNTWTSKAAMTNARGQVNGAAVGDIFYAFGGHTGGAGLDYNQAYDTVGNTWTSKLALSNPRYAATCQAFNTNIYLIGGSTASSQNNDMYDTLANTWTTKANMTTGRYYLTSAIVGSNIYVIGGLVTGADSKITEMYDIIGNTWTTKASLATARSGCCADATGNYIHVFGGSSPTISYERYDISLNTWITRSDLPGVGRNGSSAVTAANLVYLFYGNNGASPLKTVDVLIP